jgi:DNA-binding CsgD family transcriptional regulator
MVECPPERQLVVLRSLWYARLHRQRRKPVMVDLSLVNELIERIYLCALERQSWLDFMVAFEGLLPGAGSNFLITTNTSMVGSAALNTGFSEADIDCFNRHYSTVNPWTPMVASATPGKGLNTDALLEPSSLHRTEYYNGFMRPLDLKGAVGVVVTQHNGSSFVFNTMTATADFDRKQTAADVLTTLSPHLLRAFDYIQHGNGAESNTLLSAIGAGVVMTWDESRVHSINDRAREMIEGGCGITVGPTGKCRFLNGSMQQAAERLSTSTSSAPVAVFHSPGSRSPRFRYTLVRMSTRPIVEYLGGPKLAVIIERVSPRNLDQGLEMLAMAHNLTNAEREVAQCVAQGATMDMAATIRNVSKETIRSQLKSVYAKLNISGKVDLLRMLM